MQTRTFMAVLAVVTLAGCVTTDEMLDQQQEEAINTGLVRTRFEMDCPAATAELLSRKLSWSGASEIGTDRGVYTLGITGCGKRTTVVVTCPLDDSGCFAGDD